MPENLLEAPAQPTPHAMTRAGRHAESGATSPRRARVAAGKRAWKPSVATWVTTLTAVLGLTALLYPTAASWVATLNHSQVVSTYGDDVNSAKPDKATQLGLAREYNSALSSGVLLQAGENVPTGNGTSSSPEFDYWSMLVTPNRVMARLQIPKINVDLPILHGTSDETLLAGAGHLEGTSLPVGGVDTHSVITAHRGLAEATMFTDLDHVEVGDRFTISVFGEVISYRVRDTQVVRPDDTASLRQEAGQDLVTLITCTPLGINSHRILVTAERVTPTPLSDLQETQAPASVPFPFWLLIYIAGLTAAGVYCWRAGLRPVPNAEAEAEAPMSEAARE